MKITRDFGAGTYTFELTPEELEKAYREQEANYRTEDARRHILDFAGYDEDESEEYFDNYNAITIFQERYGLSLLDLANGVGEESAAIRQDIIDKFQHIFDCNIPENDLWDNTIRMVLLEHRAVNG